MIDNFPESPEEQEGKIVTLKAPRLDAMEKLYVRAFLSKLSHIEAHRVVEPTLKKHLNINKYSERENVQFHISLALQEKMEAINITPEVIIERLYHEALAVGAGTNHAARIQALQLLGKHLGMFQEKKENTAPTFTIINYGASENTQNVISEVESEKLEISDIPSNIKIQNYSVEENE